MQKMYSIGEISKYKNITIKALRYYHEQGVLIPKYIDPESGYRYYSQEQFMLIDILKWCKEIGSTTKELKYISDLKDSKEALEFLKIKQGEARENIKKMQTIINDIDFINDKINFNNKYLDNNKIEIKYFKKRRLLCTKTEKLGILNQNTDFNNLDIKTYGSYINRILEWGLLCYMNNNHILNSYVFYIVDEKSDISSYEQYIKEVPEGRYLTYGYREKDKNIAYKEIRKYLDSKNLTSNMYIEFELMVDLFNENDKMYEIQMLISE